MTNYCGPHDKIEFCTVLTYTIFIFVISKQEQHFHILHEILGKLHIRNIFIGATDKKIRHVEVTVANSVNSSQAAC